MGIDIFNIILILILLMPPVFITLIEIESTLKDIRGTLREIATRPKMLPMKVTNSHSQSDNNVFYIHYSKEELEKLSK